MEIEIEVPLDETIMHQLADGESLAYYPTFPRPYFRIQRRGVCVLQGVLGKTTFRATASRSASGTMEAILTNLLDRRKA